MLDEIKKYGLVVFIFLVAVILIKKILYSLFSGDDNNVQFSNRPSYKKEVYTAVPTCLKADFDRLDKLLNELERQTLRYNTYLSEQKEYAAREFTAKADQAERIISACWSRQQRKQDFYYCIALHYASFTLANKIKQEQLKVKDSFVAVKKKVDSYSKEIERLNKTIPQSRGSNRQEMMQRHSELCKQHKRLCILKNSIGGINSEYHRRLDKQNNETGIRRDYIIENFGTKGKRWGAKLARNKCDTA